MKKVLSWFLALIMVLSMFPVSVFAEEGADPQVPDNTVVSSEVDEGDTEGVKDEEEIEAADKPMSFKFEFGGELGNNGWYTSTGDLKITIRSLIGAEIATKSITVSVNGVTVNSTKSTIDGCVELIVGGSVFQDDGKYSVRAVATDSKGNICFSDTYVVNRDSVAQTSFGLDFGGLAEHNGVYYANGEYTMSGFVDTMSGISQVSTYGLKDSIIKVYDDVSYTTPISITSKVIGLYITDNAGNVGYVKIKDILDDAGYTDIVIDDSDPSVVVETVQSPDYYDGVYNYFAGEFYVSVVASDINLYCLDVYINEESVGYYKFIDIISKHDSFLIDKEGSNVVAATATDKSGRATTKTETYIIDKTAPTIGTLTCEGDWNVNNRTMYTADTLVIKGVPEDSSSGVKGITIYKDDVSVGTSLPFTIAESGTYYVEVTDNVGNTSKFYMSDLTGQDVSGAVVRDSEKPAVYLDASTSDSPVYTGDGDMYWYQGSPSLNVVIKDDNLRDIKVTLYKDGVPHVVTEDVSENCNYAIASSWFDEGKDFILVAEASDYSGNTSSMSYEMHIDRGVPTTGSISITSDGYNLEDDGVYTNSGFVISGLASDGDGSGIKSVSVYRDDTVVSTSNDGSVYVEVSKDSESGVYSIVVSDNVDNIKTYYVPDIITDSKSKNLIVDTVKPTINRTDTNIESATGWYSYEPVFSYSFVDDHFKSYEVYINDESVLAGNDASVSVNTALYVNCAVNVHIIAKDKAGNTEEYRYSYHHDSACPYNIGVVAPSPVNEKVGSVFYNGSIDLQVTASDDGYGMLTYYLDGVGNTSGIFQNVGGGEHFVKVSDGLGNVSAVKPLSEYCGWGGNILVIDSDPPIADAEKYNGSWENGTRVYAVALSDNIGLDRVSATVNGTEVISKSYDELGKLSDTVYVDISEVDANVDGSYNTVVTVVDNAGLSYVWTDTVYVDTVKPSIENVERLGDSWVYGVSYRFKVSDTLSGVKSVSVCKNGGEPTVLTPDTDGWYLFDVDENTKYTVSAEDNVGNKSSYDIEETYLDRTSPTISELIRDKAGWQQRVVYSFSVADSQSGVASVVVRYNDEDAVEITGKDGKYEFEVTKNGTYIIATKDVVGNMSSTSVTEEFIDTVQPTIDNLHRVESGWSQYATYEFEANDNASGVTSVELIVGGDAPVVMQPNEEGVYSFILVANASFSIKVVDVAGNIYSTGSDEEYIDTTAPVIEYPVRDKDGWNQAVTYSFSVSDSQSGVGSVSVSLGEKGIKLLNNGDGKYSFDADVNGDYVIRAMDSVGNESELKFSEGNIDTTPPVISNIKRGNSGWVTGTNYTFEVSDSQSGVVSVVVNKDGSKLYDVPFTGGNCSFDVGINGIYTIVVTDIAGNVVTEDITESYIDITDPVIVDLKRVEPSWIQESTYKFSVTEEQSGVNSVALSVYSDGAAAMEYLEPDENGVYTFHLKYNCEFTVEVIDNVGNGSSVSGVESHVDTTPPFIQEISFDGYVDSLDGGDVGYCYFFNGEGKVTIAANDGSPASGVDSVWVRFDGYDWKGYRVAGVSSFVLSVPDDFKGSLTAYSIDTVGNKGAEVKSKLIISEGKPDNTSLKVSLSDTPYTDVNGLPLYSSASSAFVTVGNSWAGLKELSWGINDINHSSTEFTGGKSEKNITTEYSTTLPLEGNANSLTLMVETVDMAGYKTSVEKKFSIDKDAPVISVTYNSTVANGYYNATRVATISVNERNFDPSKFVVGGNAGTLGTWYNNGTSWSNTLTFDRDGDYQFTLMCTDRAGNVSATYSSEKFTIDKTAPVLNVTWNNNSPKNGNYYDSPRTATVTVTEHNFDPASIVLTGNGGLAGWSNNGDTHTATVAFTSDGRYSFEITGSDIAKNAVVSKFSSGEFIIDQTAPAINFKGVSEGVSYKGNVEFSVELTDTYVDTSKVHVYLEGKNHERVELEGDLSSVSCKYVYNNFPETTDVDDVYTITAIAEDKAGNSTTQELSFSVNRFGSTYSFYDEAYLNNYLGEPKDIEISEVNVDRLDTDKVSVVITKDGKEVAVQKDWVSITEEEYNGKYLYKYKVSAKAFSEDGKYSVSVVSQSDDGTKYTSVAEQYTFVVDTSSPEVIISGIESGKNYREYSRSVTVDVRDLSGIESLSVVLNGNEVSVEERDGIYYLEVTESSSSQEITVTVVDKAGNSSVVSVDDFLITTNTWVYLINQTWFRWVVGLVLLVIILLIVLLLFRRKKDRDEEKANVAVSGELYRKSTSTGGDSSGDRILSGDAPSADVAPQEVESGTEVMGESSDTTSTEFMDDDSDVGTESM